MGAQGYRAGLGSREPTWGELMRFYVLLYACTLGPLLVLATLASA